MNTLTKMTTLVALLGTATAVSTSVTKAQQQTHFVCQKLGESNPHCIEVKACNDRPTSWPPRSDPSFAAVEAKLKAANILCDRFHRWSHTDEFLALSRQWDDEQRAAAAVANEKAREADRLRLEQLQAQLDKQLEGLPTCADSQVKKALVNAIENSPDRKLRLRVDGVSQMQAEPSALLSLKSANPNAYDTLTGLGYIDPTPKRVCSAILYTNVGKHPVSYTVEWMDKEKSKFWVEVK